MEKELTIEVAQLVLGGCFPSPVCGAAQIVDPESPGYTGSDLPALQKERSTHLLFGPRSATERLCHLERRIMAYF